MTLTTWLVVAIVILALLCIVLAAPFVLVLLLRPALQAVDGGSRKPSHVAAAMVAWAADLVTAHTVWALAVGGLKPGEWTVSDSLERLSVDMSNPNILYFRALAQYINSVSPTGKHIKAMT